MNDIRTTIVFDTETYDGYPMQFRYNGSLTINVYTGLREDGQFIDAVEVDVMTLSEPSMTGARMAVEAWLIDQFKEQQNEAFPADEMPEGCGKWGCKDCYPDEE